MNGVVYVSDSKNEKISGSSKVDATYASIKKTCSTSCPLKNEGCYAQSSFVGMIVNRLDKRARNHSPLKIAQAEVKCIDEAYNGKRVPQGRDLRIHVSGDSRTIKGTRLINRAIARWKKRGGNEAWSYTHSWDNVSRKEWSNVSILASIESIDQVERARKQGYAPALVISEHPSEKMYILPGSDVKWIPCPAQTRGISCSDCRLCFNSNRLFSQNMGIAFAAHGVKQSNIKRHLNVINNV